MQPRHRRRVALAVACAVAGALFGIAPPAGARASEPIYPSAEWFQREATNYAITSQAPLEQATDPDFQVRWNEQSTENRTDYMRRRYVDGTWWWDSTGNLCNHWSFVCTGDPYLYPGADPFYDNEGLVEEAIYFDAQGALLSGRVWVPKSSQPGDQLPGVVLETGSVQAPETMYWWMAQALVRQGYAVMTYDVRGQGRSDNRTPSGTAGSNANSNVFATNLVDTIEFFLSTPETPYPRVGERTGAPIDDFNPFHDRIDHDRLGIIGHSLGASGASVVQGMDPWPGRLLPANPVDVAVAWDNLSATANLGGQSVKPRVPTMGQSADYGLVPTPFTSPPNPEGRNAGFAAWQNAGVPSYQVNIRGGTHYEWSRIPSFPTSSWEHWGNPLAEHYTLAWLDRWLKLPGEAGYDTADARLLDDASWTDRMSFYFRSARAFPTRDGTWQRCADIKAGCEIATPQEPRPTSLSLTVEGNGAKRTLTATLLDAESGSGVAGKEISFFSGGEFLGTATTDSAGIATFSPRPPYHAGHRTYTAEFAGDDDHGASSAEATS